MINNKKAQDYEWVGWFVFLAFVFIIIGSIIYFTNLSAEASDTATRQCREKGFETYVHFYMKCCSAKPYNLVCGSMKERMIFEGKITAYDFENTKNKSIILNLNNGAIK